MYATEKNEIVWEAPEFNYSAKGAGWYSIFAVAFFLIILFALLKKNFFFFVFLVISGIMVVYLGERKPENVKFKLSSEGFKIGDSETVYRYADISGFAIVPKPHRSAILVLKKKAIANPYLKIPLAEGIEGEVKKFLEGKSVHEGEYEETLLETLIEWVGF